MATEKYATGRFWDKTIKKINVKIIWVRMIKDKTTKNDWPQKKINKFCDMTIKPDDFGTLLFILML
jgi:hypothetical protein